MSAVSVDLPANVNQLYPLTADIGGTGVSNPIDNTLTILGGPVILDGSKTPVQTGPVVAAGVTAGSAGDPTKCNAPFVLQVLVGMTTYYIPAFTQNT